MVTKKLFAITGSAMLTLFCFTTQAQDDDLLALLGEDSTVDYVTAGFKTTRVINLQSFENNAAGVLDFKISHRFNYLNGGAYEFFGLDGATLRLGLEYGITKRLMVGVGRSTVNKTYDSFFKYKILRQSKGAKKMPVSMSWFSSIACNTLKWTDTTRTNYFSSRLHYVHQLIIGRKFSEGFSAQLSPTVVHRNLVKTEAEPNDVFALGIGTRQKITRRTSINLEYIYVLPDQLDAIYNNSLSVGFDIETGGHVFQLHFTNSRAMTESYFITETDGEWSAGDISFGFNISRVFTLKKNSAG
ncbi:MAG: DUF5777 family beta-barrel protein [Flavobacteriales bacterium]|nr:DUF5777 family beta-barrel protein [Flavobacteriales bacterium]